MFIINNIYKCVFKLRTEMIHDYSKLSAEVNNEIIAGFIQANETFALINSAINGRHVLYTYAERD